MGGPGARAGRVGVSRRGIELATLLTCGLLCLAAGGWTAQARAATLLSAPDLSRPVPVADSAVAPPGRRLSPRAVLAIAAGLAPMRDLVRRHPGAFGDAYLKGPRRWQVSYFTRSGRREIGQVLIADHDGRVLEQWTGPQVAWTMARGYPGAFGDHVSALYIWIPLSLLFLAPFIRWRRPLSLRHLDLLALSLFSVSLAFFNRGDIGASVPLSYPPLLYLLARLLVIARVGRRRDPPAGVPPPPLTVPRPLVVAGLAVLIAVRLTLNLADSSVIDVGYAGVIGAHRILHGQALYGHWPANNARGDTYGPVSYEAYVPFVALLGWSGHWDRLPAAHLASIVFDLLALGLCFLLGRRVRGPTLGLALAYAWAAFPFTLYALDSNTNDSLVAVFVLGALLAGSVPARGALAALGGLAKFAPLALAPLLASDGLRAGGAQARALRLGGFLLAFAVAAAAALLPALAHDSPATVYERTLGYQAGRASPFSIWGMYPGLHTLRTCVRVGAVVLALAVALAPRRRDVVGTAAAAGAVLIALQLGLDHWFYLYIPWFYAPVMLAVLAGGRHQPAGPAGGASEPVRSRRLAVA